MPRARRFRQLASYSALFATALAGLIALLWIVRPSLTFDAQSLWLMKANTALCVACVGIAFHLTAENRSGGWQDRLRHYLLVLAGIVATLTLIEYVAVYDLGIDTWFAGDPSALYPGRMAPQTAGMLVLLIAGGLTARYRAGAASHICDGAIIGAGVAIHIVMSGYLFHNPAFTGISPQVQTSPHTVLALSALWASLLFLRADSGLFSILSEDGRGSDVIRYLMPWAIFGPVVVAGFRLWGEMAGWPIATSEAAFSAAQNLLRITVITALGFMLNRSETLRREEKARRIEAERMVAICAWTRQVRWQGEWVPVEVFLKERFGLETTHGMSDEAFTEQLALLDRHESKKHAA